MQINKQKTKVISFTKSRKWDFPPEVNFSDGTQIECVPHIKLLGVIVSQDLRWNLNTEYICMKARQKLWILRRMIKLDLDASKVFDTYTKEVRSILELAVPVWHSRLTKQNNQDIERIQKLAFQIILQESYQSYPLACSHFGAKTLYERRIKLCSKFATKNFKSDNCLFTKLRTTMHTRHRRNIVKEYKCNTGCFQKSSLPYLAKLLNSNNRK